MSERIQNSINMGLYNVEEAVKEDLTATIDWTLSTKFELVVDAAYAIEFVAPLGPCNLVLKLVDGGAAAFTWAEAANILWVGGAVPEWTVSGTDIVSFYYDGNNYHGAAGLAFAVPA